MTTKRQSTYNIWLNKYLMLKRMIQLAELIFYENIVLKNIQENLYW